MIQSHYLNVLLNILKSLPEKRAHWFLFHSQKCIAMIKCKSYLDRDDRTAMLRAECLENYYPNKGKVSDRRGFAFPEFDVDFSIIIPTYNNEGFIETSLDSVFSQRTKYSYEVILIDDGSWDKTSDIVQRYLNADNLILIEKKNGGQSVARNMAITISRGSYLMFLDADDILLPGSIDSLMNAAIKTDSDIAEGCIVRFYDNITEEMLHDSKGKNHMESNSHNPKFVLTTYGYSVAKVFRRELWETLRYPEGYIFEDVITKFILRRKANQVVFIEDVVYGYRQNPQSSSHGGDKLKKLDSIWVLPQIFKLCEQENAPRDDVFYLLALNHIGLLNYITTKYQSQEIQAACFAEMRKQLLSIQDCRCKRMPLMFKLLERSILEDKMEAWQYIAETISKYCMLKKWREIN